MGPHETRDDVKQAASPLSPKQVDTMMTENYRPQTPDSSPSKSLDGASPSKSSKNRKRRNKAANKQATPGSGSGGKQSKLPVRQASKPVAAVSPTQVPSTRLQPASESKQVTAPKPANSQQQEDLREQVRGQANQINELVEQMKLQVAKTRDREAALHKSGKMCVQLEKLLESELSAKSSLEMENTKLSQTVSRLRQQVGTLEKSKLTNEELIRVLNATLMERETEISILKLKLTRFQTNLAGPNYPSSSTSNVSTSRPQQQAIRSTPAFERNSQLRSTTIADSTARASTSHLRSDDRDSSIWAKVPQELTPSKRPLLLERNMNLLNEELNNLYGTTSAHFDRDRRYKTLPRSMKSPSQEFPNKNNQSSNAEPKLLEECQVTNLDDSNSTSQGSQGNRTLNYSGSEQQASNNEPLHRPTSFNRLEQHSNNYSIPNPPTETLYSNPTSTPPSRLPHNPPPPLQVINSTKLITHQQNPPMPPRMPPRTSTTPAKFSSKVKKLFHLFKSSNDSAAQSNSASKTDLTSYHTTPVHHSSPFRRGPSRSTMLAAPCDIRAQMTQSRQVMSFQTDKPFAEWDTNMLVDWLTMIGLSMYAAQCKRWVKCGADILNATPMEVDKGLGITNHLHRKKLRLAISELNGDCDKITKAAAKLDYLWVARWLDDIGLPQYKESFINARVDGRVLNYLTVEDLISLGVKSVLHHVSIKCGIRVLRSLQFDLQLLKRRATADEIEQMSSVKQNLTSDPATSDHHQSPSIHNTGASPQTGAEDSVVALWTCHRVMEWLRLIDFAEFSPNLRGSGVHGGLIVFEDGFSAETMCALLCIPASRTLLRRHLFNYFKLLLGTELAEKKRLYLTNPSNQPLNPSAEIKTAKKSQPWFSKIKSSLVGQEATDEYLHDLNSG